MSDAGSVSEEIQDLIDEYLDGLLDGAGLEVLDARLRGDGEALRYFVRYCRLHADLELRARARVAADHALRTIVQGPAAGRSGARRFFGRTGLAAALKGAAGAAVVLLAAGGIRWLVRAPADPVTVTVAEGDPGVARLVNAQDCRWAEGSDFAGDMGPGKVLRLEGGLAELYFRCGARAILQGPATLELLSDRSARLLRGGLSAKVPESARGFEILSPEGKVVDLGTEFGIRVAEDGSARVVVYRGKVRAQPAGAATGAAPIVGERQAARIGDDGVTLVPADREVSGLVREIVPQPAATPRILDLDFRRAVEGTLRDGAGLGTGLTHRLPGTGHDLPASDPNLRLDRQAGRLEVTTDDNDLSGQRGISRGEYLGVRLSDLGFTGSEDFSVTAVVPNTPPLKGIGQFGLFAGARSDRNIRGGLLLPGSNRIGDVPYTQFFVNNDGGEDSRLYMVGLASIGDEIRFTLLRTGGRYSLEIENYTTGEASTLTSRHAEFLDGARDLYVGLFAATPESREPRTLFVREFKVTVWARRVGAGRRPRGGARKMGPPGIFRITNRAGRRNNL